MVTLEPPIRLRIFPKSGTRTPISTMTARSRVLTQQRCQPNSGRVIGVRMIDRERKRKGGKNEKEKEG